MCDIYILHQTIYLSVLTEGSWAVVTCKIKHCVVRAHASTLGHRLLITDLSPQ